MLHIEKGKKYVILEEYNNGDISFKDVVCRNEFVNFQKAQRGIETTDNEFYPLSDVYESKEQAIKEYFEILKKMKMMLKKEIKKKEDEINKCKEKIVNIEKNVKRIKIAYDSFLNKGK